MYLCVQLHSAGREDGPTVLWDAAAVTLFFYTTWFYLNRKCSVPTTALLRLDSESCEHSRRAFITLCRCLLALTITHLHLRQFFRPKPSQLKALL